MNERRSARRSSRRSTRSCLGPHERPAFSGPKPVSALGHRRDGLRPQTTHLRRAANPLLKPSLAEGDPHRSMLSNHCSTLTAGASISASSGSSSFNAFRPLQHPHRGGVDFGFEWILIVQCFPPTAAGRRTPNLQGSILIFSVLRRCPLAERFGGLRFPSREPMLSKITSNRPLENSGRPRLPRRLGS